MPRFRAMRRRPRPRSRRSRSTPAVAAVPAAGRRAQRPAAPEAELEAADALQEREVRAPEQFARPALRPVGLAGKRTRAKRLGGCFGMPGTGGMPKAAVRIIASAPVRARAGRGRAAARRRESLATPRTALIEAPQPRPRSWPPASSSPRCCTTASASPAISSSPPRPRARRSVSRRSGSRPAERTGSIAPRDAARDRGAVLADGRSAQRRSALRTGKALRGRCYSASGQ